MFCQDIHKTNGVNSNAHPQRVALKETQDLKVKLQECLQLSATNNYANRQHAQGHNIMANGPHKPVSATQSSLITDSALKPKGSTKQEHCSAQRHHFTQIDKHSSAHSQDENKENNEKGQSKKAMACK